jgi:hypothetical protein
MSETISPTFTFVKDGVFYFSRRIPKELLRHYVGGYYLLDKSNVLDGIHQVAVNTKEKARSKESCRKTVVDKS